MDFPVEATVHLNNFHSEAQVRTILRTHGFELIDLSRDQVRVKGSFLNLKSVKASLELLLYSQTKTDIAPFSSFPVLRASSGAVSKRYTRTDGAGSRSGSRNKPPRASPSSPTFPSPLPSGSSNSRPISPEYRPSFPPTPHQHGAFRPGKDSIAVDADVFGYAKKLKEKDIDHILKSHNVIMQVCDVSEDSCSITLLGKNAKSAVGKLQSLLDNLSRFLCTQDVLLEDMDREGRALLERIKKRNNIYNLVLVCQKKDKLHLVGSSSESYELKQRLLGRSVDRSGRTGRTRDKNDRQRSSSLPPISRRNTDRDPGAVSNPSPAGAADYSSQKYQDKQEDVEPDRGAAAAAAAARFDPGRVFRRRSQSESRKKRRPERTNSNPQDMEKKLPPAESPKKGLMGLLTQVDPTNIKQKVKEMRKRR